MNDYGQAHEALLQANKIKDEILQIQNKEIERMVENFRNKSNLKILVQQQIHGNENILESRKRMSELFDFEQNEKIKPRNTEISDESSIQEEEKGESSSEEGKINEEINDEIEQISDGIEQINDQIEQMPIQNNEEAEQESYLLSVIRNNPSQDQILQQGQNGQGLDVQPDPNNSNENNLSIENNEDASESSSLCNFEIQSAVSIPRARSQAFRKYKRQFEIDYFYVWRWYQASIKSQRNLVSLMKQELRQLYKNNQIEILEAMNNNERPSNRLVSILKRPIREKIENDESPQQMQEINRQMRLGRRLNQNLIPERNINDNYLQIEERENQQGRRRRRSKKLWELGDIRFFKSPFSNYILQVKAARMMTEAEIQKLKNLKRQLSVYRRHWKHINLVED